MPRYHFNVHAAGSHIADGEGMMLRDDAAAVDHACQIAREIVSVDVREDGVVQLSQTIEIVGDDGTAVNMIPFADIIRVVRD